MAGFEAQRLLDVADEGAEQIKEHPVRLSNTRQDVRVDQGAEYDRGHPRFLGAAVNAHGHFGRLFQRVHERQADRLEIDLFKLRKH